MNVSDTLNLAADLIEERGWIQGEHVSPDGFCVMGALQTVCGAEIAFGRNENADWWQASMAIVTHVGTAVAIWNDRPERTAAHVIETLRAAALIEQAREDAALLAEVGR